MTFLLIGCGASPKYLPEEPKFSDNPRKIGGRTEVPLRARKSREGETPSVRNPASVYPWLMPWQMARFVDNRSRSWIRIWTIDRFQFESTLRKDPPQISPGDGSYRQMECIYIYICINTTKHLPKTPECTVCIVYVCICNRYSRTSDWREMFGKKHLSLSLSLLLLNENSGFRAIHYRNLELRNVSDRNPGHSPRLIFFPLRRPFRTSDIPCRRDKSFAIILQ